MTYSVLVKIEYGLDNLSHDVSGLSLRKTLMFRLFDALEQVM
jgi:hypothetical protein